MVFLIILIRNLIVYLLHKLHKVYFIRHKFYKLYSMWSSNDLKMEYK